MTPNRIADSRPPAPTPTPVAAGTPEERVLASFQETMRAFLDVQRSTMLAYLGARSAPTQPATPAPPAISLPPALGDRLTARPPAPAPPVLRPAVVAPPAAESPRPTPDLAAAAIVPGPAPEPTPAAPAALAVGRAAVADRLVEIVRDRTGYPAEMLGLDLDLEADLGIDSIKRVEILGSLRESVAVLASATDAGTMDSLARARTLGAIVDRVDEIARRQVARRSPPASKAGGARERGLAPAAAEGPGGDDADPEPAASSVRRLVIEPVAAPLGSFGAAGGLVRGGVVVVTDDGRGVGRALASRLDASGHPVLLAGPGRFDLGSPASVDLLLEQARATGPLAAIVHAAPLRVPAAEAGLDPARWASRLGPEVRGLFLLAKGAAADLDRAARRGGGALIAATALGGSFGSATGEPADFFPGHGGIAGLMKTLAREWPGVRSRVVDFDPRDEARSIADRLVAEALADDGWSEVGYRGGARVRLAAIPGPLARPGSTRLDLEPGAPVLVTGGARGITAAVALELARAWRPTLLLVGRSPLPPEAEDAQTAGIEATADLKAALLGRLRRDRPVVTPADLDRAYSQVRRGREIRANLAAIRAAGATVEYAPVDVRDAGALAAVLDGWKRRHGPPAGLIHGAGVIQDKLIRDKTLGSFDAVLGTKLDGALNLARLLDPAPLRFAALFSSIAGRFGNAGQSDYAAANEVLNKLALWLDRRWPGRVVAMNWGPWSGVGMVSDLEGHLGARGLGMIPPAVGRSILLDELRYGPKGRVEVVAAGELGDLADPIAVAVARPTPERAAPRPASAGAGAGR